MEAAIYAHGSSELKLAEARQSSGLTLTQIANTTRISMRFLEAIEAENFRKLPGGIFAVNYVKQYARCIGFDEDRLVECCKRYLDPEPSISDLAALIEAVAPPRRPARGLRLPLVRIGMAWTTYVRRRAQRSAPAGA